MELTSLFFAPDYKTVLEAVKTTKDQYSPFRVMNEIIQKYYNEFQNESHDLKTINTESLFNYINTSLGALEMVKFFNKPKYYGITCEPTDKLGSCGVNTFIKNVTCTLNDKSIFAVGRLTKDIITNDNDCYETAGGYRSFISPENTTVFFYLSSDNSIGMRFEGHCIIDHYNNNFAGVSTGNGSTNYKLGERVENRVINTKLHSFTKLLKEYDVTIEKIDLSKGLEIAKKNIE